MERITRIRASLREERREDESVVEVYRRRRVEFIRRIKEIGLRKLEVFIQYGLPQKNDNIQIPLNYCEPEAEGRSGEVRVLEGLKIDQYCSATSLKHMMIGRRKEAGNGEERGCEEVLASEKLLKVGDFGQTSKQRLNGLKKAKIDLSTAQNSSTRSRTTRSNSSSQEGLEKSSFSVFGPQRPKNTEFRFCHNLEEDRIEVISVSSEKKKNHNSPPKFSSVLEILVYVKKHSDAANIEAQKKKKAIFDLMKQNEISEDELLSKSSSLITSLEELKAISEFVEARAHELAQHAEKKSQMFTDQIEELQKEIKRLNARSNF